MKRTYRIIAIAVALLLTFSSFVWVWADKPFVLSGTHIYKERNIYHISNTGKGNAFDIVATVPIGADITSGSEKMLWYSTTPGVTSIKRDSDGNILGVFVIKQLKAGAKTTIKVEKTVQNSGITFSKALESANADYSGFNSNPNNVQYLKPSHSIESDDKEIKQKAGTLNRSSSVVLRAKDIYDFVNLYIGYNENPKYSNKGALSAIRTKQGVCYEYATLFTALCRTSGIPARVVTGYWKNKPLPANQWINVANERHAWAEFFMPEAGWIPVEPTFFLKVNGQRKPDHDYFGALPESSRHFITGYGTSHQSSAYSVVYKFYKQTRLDIEAKTQEIMLADNTAVTTGFVDSSGSWAGEYIERLYLSGILFAKKGKEYKPEDKITRAEFSAYLVNALKLNADTKKTNFKDVKGNNPLVSHIAAASNAGLIKGYKGSFNPNASISRQDAAAIMERALTMMKKQNDTPATLNFKDNASISSYAVNAVQRMSSLEIMNGQPGNLFAPKSDMTRAEAAKIIDCFLKVIQ